MVARLNQSKGEEALLPQQCGVERVGWVVHFSLVTSDPQ